MSIDIIIVLIVHGAEDGRAHTHTKAHDHA